MRHYAQLTVSPKDQDRVLTEWADSLWFPIESEVQDDGRIWHRMMFDSSTAELVRASE